MYWYQNQLDSCVHCCNGIFILGLYVVFVTIWWSRFLRNACDKSRRQVCILFSFGLFLYNHLMLEQRTWFSFHDLDLIELQLVVAISISEWTLVHFQTMLKRWNSSLLFDTLMISFMINLSLIWRGLGIIAAAPVIKRLPLIPQRYDMIHAY